MFRVIDGKITREGNTLEIPGLHIRKEISRGANGIVFLAHDYILERNVAVKIWTSLRNNARRNKILQGYNETRKLIKASINPKKEFCISEPYENISNSGLAEIYSAGHLMDG